jgi:hypothetical protein
MDEKYYYLIITSKIMNEGAEAKRDILTFELGDLQETLVSTKNEKKWHAGEGLTKEKKVGARVCTSLLLLMLMLPPPQFAAVIVATAWWCIRVGMSK